MAPYLRRSARIAAQRWHAGPEEVQLSAAKRPSVRVAIGMVESSGAAVTGVRSGRQ